MDDFKNCTNEELIENHNRVKKLCKEKEQLLMYLSNCVAQEVKMQLESLRSEKSEIENEMSKRGMEYKE
ncbi:hypothetical protein CLOACE_21630 [Clostridium acetireducens DSM 10703]|uniref:Uncharacterized protein n=1 Tax=Clostridium acetireducens DSM 10703 TaxID=1121290 RepID=A0A1E8EVT6_9CLOT|nr:hypothetical protein [Clostridium acetireducens]OFI01375.1 hypothetical protein CLOACE_21630 [Clostridium acetireducens DSM 10703]